MFRRAQTAIETSFLDAKVTGNANGRPRAGAFEVTVTQDGGEPKLVWSKLSGQGFPSTAALQEAVRAAL